LHKKLIYFNSFTMKLRQRQLPTTRLSKKKQDARKALCRKNLLESSPSSRKIKKNQQDCLIESAYNELLAIRAANGGNQRYNDISTVVSRANKRGCGTVERHHIENRVQQGKLGKLDKSKAPENPPEKEQYTKADEKPDF
jgi:hypothetical protein